jgi:putative transposase
MAFPHKNIRRPAAHYLGQRSYFIALCCASRHPAFANPDRALELIAEFCHQSLAYHFSVLAYCVMKEHFHALVRGLHPTSDLLAFVKNLKETTTRRYYSRSHRLLWQKKIHDHILHENESIEPIANYIFMNPVRKGLCAVPCEYPFSGSLVHDWKKLILLANGWLPAWKTGARASQRRNERDMGSS